MSEVIDLVSSDEASVDLVLSSTDAEDDDGKLQSPPEAELQTTTKVMNFSRPPKGLFNVNWARKAPNIISYLKINPRPKRKPTVVKKFGYDKFKLKGNRLFVFGREVVLDKKLKLDVLSKEETGYGGTRKAYARISKKYLGISAKDVRNYFAESERRQLKMPKQGRGVNRAFIHAPRPGVIEADCTFYHGQKIVVFGMVDVFSRWCHYEVIKYKKPIDTGAALLNGIQKFHRASLNKHKLYEVRTDSGSEFLHDERNKGSKNPKPDFRSILLDIQSKAKHFKIIHRKQPMRIIEGLNGILRRYVQRIDFTTKEDLGKIIERFCREYNESPSKPLGNKTPNDVIRIHGKENLEKEASRQFAAKQRKVGTSAFRLKELKVGSLVRISLLADKEKLGHHGEKPNWSKKIWVVTKIMKSSRGPLRYKVKLDGGNKTAGPFFRDRLLAIVRPTHALNQKSKYQPGARKKGDIQREKAALRPDKAPQIKWAARKTYEDMQDERESSGSEYLPDEPVGPVAPKKNAGRAIKPKPKMKMVARKVVVKGHGNAVVIEKYRGVFIVYFAKDKSLAAFDDEDIHRLTSDFVSEAFVKKIKRDMGYWIDAIKETL